MFASLVGRAVRIMVVACAPVTVLGQGARHLEITATLPTSHGDSAWLEVFVPAGVPRVQSVVVFIDRGLDQYAYDDRNWRAMCRRVRCALLRLGLPRQDEAAPAAQLVRNAAIGGGAMLLDALKLAAQRTQHPEIAVASVILFGHSAAGSFAVTFATWRPDRTLGFVRYHSNLRGVEVDTAALATIPSLTIVGSRDEVAGTDDSRRLWQALRSRRAPVAFVSHVGEPHLSIDGLVEAGYLMRAWVAALAASQPELTSTARNRSARGERAGGWLLDDSTKAGAPAALFDGSPLRSSWVPTEAVVTELRVLAGMCAPISPSLASDVLGAEARIAVEEVTTCRYTTGTPTRDLWLRTTRLGSADAARGQLQQSRSATGGLALRGLGDAAFFVADSSRRCSTVGAAQFTRTFFVSLCGDGLGKLADSAQALMLARRLLGQR